MVFAQIWLKPKGRWTGLDIGVGFQSRTRLLGQGNDPGQSGAQGRL